VVDWLVKDFKNSYGTDLSKDKMALQAAAQRPPRGEDRAVQLDRVADRPCTSHHSEQGPLHLDTKLSRAGFPKMTSDLLDRCKARRSSR
jgi:molecular chaperone DnaK